MLFRSAVIRDLLADHKQTHGIVGLAGRDAHTVTIVMDRLAKLGQSLSATLTQQARARLRGIITRINIEPGQLVLILSRDGLWKSLGVDSQDQQMNAEPSTQLATTAISLPFEVRRRGVEARLVIGGEEQRQSLIDQRLVDTITQAANWMKRLTSGAYKSVADLARQDGFDDGEISRVLPLAFLAPDIVTAIVEGRQPVSLTTRYLQRLKPLPASWVEQRRLLGFAPVTSV